MSGQNEQFNAVTSGIDGESEKTEAVKNETDDQRESEVPSDKYFEDKEQSCVYLGVEVPKGNGEDLVPNKEAFKDYFYTEEDYELMRELATAMRLKQPLIVEGGTGIGKTSAVKRMCADLHMNYGLVSFSESTDLTDVIGHKDIVIEDGEEKIQWFDGYAMKIIREGGVLFLDEYNFQGGKVGGRINPIIDAILNGDKTINLTENDNELVQVHPDLVLVAAQNPPGHEDGEEFTGRDVLSAEKFGRWTFHKLAGRMSKEMEQQRMQGMIGMDVETTIASEEFRFVGEGVPLSELKEVPGMNHWVQKYVEIREILESKVRDRSMGRQAQKIYFNPRLGQKILRYVAAFYRGDINETWKNALTFYIEKMFKSDEDREAVRTLVNQSKYVPSEKETKRKGLGREKKSSQDESGDGQGDDSDTDSEGEGSAEGSEPSAVEPEVVKTPEELEKERTLAKIEKIRREIKRSDEMPEELEKARTVAKIEKIRREIKRSDETPEDWFKEQIITATSPEGEPITFDLKQILTESKDLYNEMNLAQWSNELPETIELTEEEIQNIKELVEKHGFNRIRIFPSTQTQNSSLEKLTQEATTSIEGLEGTEQYAEEGLYMTDSVKEAFPDDIRNKNRPDGCYIQLYRDDAEAPDDTKNKTYPEARAYQKENALHGYTLAEYLIFQRAFTKEHKKHPEATSWTWIADSEIGDVASPRVLNAKGNPDDRQVMVNSGGSGDHGGGVGFRSSAVVSLEH